MRFLVYWENFPEALKPLMDSKVLKRVHKGKKQSTLQFSRKRQMEEAEAAVTLAEE